MVSYIGLIDNALDFGNSPNNEIDPISFTFVLSTLVPSKFAALKNLKHEPENALSETESNPRISNLDMRGRVMSNGLIESFVILSQLLRRSTLKFLHMFPKTWIASSVT
jgi:hypothetical protein